MFEQGNPCYYGSLCAIFYDATKKFASKEELDFYCSFMHTNGWVLEAMTGSGRLQIPLMQMGYQVDGVDCSSEMLKRCVERSAVFGLVPNLYQQWLQDLDLPHKYQTVVIAVGSFQLITDRKVALQSLQKIADHMLPDGDLLFSIFDPCISSESWSKRVVRLDHKTTLNLTTSRSIDQADKLANAYCNYELVVAGQIVRSEQELIEVTWYTEAELAQLLDVAGFELVKIYDYPLPNDDGSCIVHAKLKKA